jgi:hypothetical protein
MRPDDELTPEELEQAMNDAAPAYRYRRCA